MPVTDPIADMLTSIRNACTAKHRRVDVPLSKMKVAIADVLMHEKFISKYRIIEDSRQGVLRMYLRYNNEEGSIIRTGDGRRCRRN